MDKGKVNKNKANRKKVNRKNNIKTCSDGKMCKYLNDPDDVPTKVASLGFRVITTLISCICAGNTIQYGKSFFTSMFLFSLPLYVDYLRFKPRVHWRELIRKAGATVSFIELLISFIGFNGILEILYKDNYVGLQISNKYVVLQGCNINVKFVWSLLGISVLISALDWVACKRKLEYDLEESDKKEFTS